MFPGILVEPLADFLCGPASCLFADVGGKCRQGRGNDARVIDIAYARDKIRHSINGAYEVAQGPYDDGPGPGRRRGILKGKPELEHLFQQRTANALAVRGDLGAKIVVGKMGGLTSSPRLRRGIPYCVADLAVSRFDGFLLLDGVCRLT